MNAVPIVVPDLPADCDALTAALAYAKAGLFVGPIARGRKDPSTVLGKGWPRLTSTDPHMIAAWFAGTDHGVMLHAGRSGLVVLDVDTPENLHPLVRRALDELEPPFQVTREGQPGRGHYLFAQPPGRMLGNSLGRLAAGWGEVRGRNGLVVVAPSVHPEPGGHYRWARTGPVPVLPDYLAAELPEALPTAESVATSAEVSAFLDAHTAMTRPELVEVHARAFAKAVEAGESRHHTMTGHLAGAMREAAAGLVDARTAADTLEAAFLTAVTVEGHGRQGKARSRGEARHEWTGLLAWAVAQAQGADVAEIRARVADRVPQVEDWTASLPAASGEANASPDTDNPSDVATDEDRAERARRLFPRLDWHALWADDGEDEWIHHPLLPARRSVVIYSPPKVGKSLLVLELAVAVSRGETFLEHKVERRYRVLYVDFENDPRGDVRSRLQAMGYGPDDLDHLDYLSFPTMAGLDTERGALELLEAVHAYGSELVVIDTVSRAVDGEENSNDTWLGLYRRTGLRLKQAGVALLRLDHTGKDESKGQRGGSAKSGDVDAIWRLSRITDQRFRLECTDARLPVSTKSLQLIRETYPRLHHTVQVLGAMTDREARVAHLVRLCDENGLPADTGRDGIRAFAKARGEAGRNDLFAEVARVRKAAAGPVPEVGDSGPDGDRSGPVPEARDSTAATPTLTSADTCPQVAGTGGDSTHRPPPVPVPRSLERDSGTAGQNEDHGEVETRSECDFGGCAEPARPGRVMCALHFTREPVGRSA